MADQLLGDTKYDPGASFGIVSSEHSGGTHTSRTMMLADLEALLAATPNDAPQQAYKTAVIGDNVLGKGSESSRKRSFRYLRELYLLDPTCSGYSEISSGTRASASSTGCSKSRGNRHPGRRSQSARYRPYMAKRFLGFMPKDAPDEVIVAYIKEAGKIAKEWTGEDKALSQALSPVWEKHFGQLTENPPLAAPNE